MAIEGFNIFLSIPTIFRTYHGRGSQRNVKGIGGGIDFES